MFLLILKNILNFKNYSVLYKIIIISRIDENEREFVEFLIFMVDEEDVGVWVGGGGSFGIMEVCFVVNMWFLFCISEIVFLLYFIVSVNLVVLVSFIVVVFLVK